MLERFIAVLIFLTLFPLLFIISLFIFISDGLPIFFIQRRIGINQDFFNIYKFRTMKINTPNIATHLLKNESKHLLKSGRIIRKLSLDELPNIINVIKGEMVFIGPRPALHNQKKLINLRISLGIDKVKPGITGWAQINGRDLISVFEKVKFEKEYLKRKSCFFDIKILINTFIKVLFIKGIKH